MAKGKLFWDGKVEMVNSTWNEIFRMFLIQFAIFLKFCWKKVFIFEHFFTEAQFCWKLFLSTGEGQLDFRILLLDPIFERIKN